jgi:membrane-bound ClpP family serine protease
MKLSAFLGLAGAIGMLFGLEFLVIPELALSQYGIPTEAHNQLQARYFGSTLLASGLLLWLARAAMDAATQRALLIASTVGNLIGLALSVWSRLNGLQGSLAWLAVALYGALLLGSLYYLLRPGRRS